MLSSYDTFIMDSMTQLGSADNQRASTTCLPVRLARAGEHPVRFTSVDSRINSGRNQRFRNSIANMRVQFLTGRHPKLLARERLDIFLASVSYTHLRAHETR